MKSGKTIRRSANKNNSKTSMKKSILPKSISSKSKTPTMKSCSKPTPKTNGQTHLFLLISTL
jgi:SMC interacting uncharacterized protein involved in chromosome segregation